MANFFQDLADKIKNALGQNALGGDNEPSDESAQVENTEVSVPDMVENRNFESPDPVRESATLDAELLEREMRKIVRNNPEEGSLVGEPNAVEATQDMLRGAILNSDSDNLEQVKQGLAANLTSIASGEAITEVEVREKTAGEMAIEEGAMNNTDMDKADVADYITDVASSLADKEQTPSLTIPVGEIEGIIESAQYEGRNPEEIMEAVESVAEIIEQNKRELGDSGTDVVEEGHGTGKGSSPRGR